MTSLLRSLLQPAVEERDSFPMSMQQYVDLFSYNGVNYPLGGMQQTLVGNREVIGSDFGSIVAGAYRSDAILFACCLVRMLHFTEGRFQFRQIRQGRPGNLFGTTELGVLETPWANGTTGDLLARMIQDTDLAGNAYVLRVGDTLTRLRPDWVQILIGSRSRRTSWEPGDDDSEVIGYIYQAGGHGSGRDPVLYDVSQVAHWTPIPDPVGYFRGISWVSSLIREVMADQAMTAHKLKYLENGAPQPLDAKVLTPNGWSTMGALAVGDEVIGSDGGAKTITAVYPQGEQDIYRVTFTDGASTECTLDHLWQVSLGGYKPRTIPLRQIMEQGLGMRCGALRWSVDFAEPVSFAQPDEALPLDPYLLGMLLGDGCFRGTPNLAGNLLDAEETEELLQPVLPDGTEMRFRQQGDGSARWSLTNGYGRKSNPVTTRLRTLGLFDLVGHQKFIPREYMLASIGDRVSLLQGLVDSDGHVEAKQRSSVSITTTSETLAQQICDLVGSLGGWGTYVPELGKRTFRVRIKRLPAWIIPCRLKRKVARYSASTRVRRRRWIETVEFVGRKQAQCISVDSADHLYVTDDYVLTHNTVNLVVKVPAETVDKFNEWVVKIREGHEGVRNAYRTMFLGAGADVQALGSNMQQMDFKVVQGAGEVRIATVARVPPPMLGIGDGLQGAALNAGNHASIRRMFADGCIRPLWRGACGALATVTRVPNGAELWMDDRDVAFLKEDMKDFATVQGLNATTISSLITSGYDPDAAVDAVTTGDFSRLKGAHSGLMSVQLLPPNSNNGANGSSNGKAPPVDTQPVQ